MLASLLIIGTSAAMFCYWFRYTCLLILSTETNEDFSRQVAVEYGLQFARLHDEIQHAGSEALAMAMTTLDREYGLMRSLLDRSGAGEEAGFERTLLGANYFALRTWFRLSCRFSEATARKSLIEISQIVRHFANAAGEHHFAAASSR